MTKAQQALLHYQAPRWEDFPEMNLYMDQVISLLSRWLEPLYFRSDKPPVTSSMINNYVKHSIVRAPVRKQYKRYHLAYLYVVFVLKQCFSLQDISALIQIYSDIENTERTGRDFNSFASLLEKSLHEVMETGTITCEGFEAPSWQQQLMTTTIRTIAYQLFSAARIDQVRDAAGQAGLKK